MFGDKWSLKLHHEILMIAPMAHIKAKMAIEAKNIFRTPFPTSRPSALTRDLKLEMTSGFSGAVRKVTRTQARVVIQMVHNSFS